MGVTVLLDTHALIWALAEVDRLSPTARNTIADPANTILVSSVSAWEIATKHRLGRLPEAESIVHSYCRHVATLGAIELPMTAEHALLAGSLPGQHRDPFDRMLAAQALIEGIAIVTLDAAISGFQVSTLW
jgi:PIN domain nuclease of toxin-antitoxin system